MQNNAKQDVLLKPKEAAALLSISLRTLWWKVLKGEIPYLLFGSTVRFDKSEILSYGRKQAKERASKNKKLQESKE